MSDSEREVIAALDDDQLLARIESNAALIQHRKEDLDAFYADRIAMFQEARRRVPPISHARIAAAAGVNTTAAVINALKKASTVVA